MGSAAQDQKGARREECQKRLSAMAERVREELGLEQTAGEHLVQRLAGDKTSFKFKSLCSRAVQPKKEQENKKKNLCSCSANKCVIHLFWLV